jgi:hypothetical protein
MSFWPHAEPQFGLAARSLVHMLQAEARVEERLQVLLKLNRDVGDAWYPIYLKLLVVIGESAPAPAQVLVADAIGHGLRQGQTAGGTLGSWGVPTPLPAALAVAGKGFLRMSAARVLDPLTYLTVWFSQSTSRQPLPLDAFEKSLTGVLQLFDASASARSIYQAKLRADVSSSTEGAYSATSLLRLGVLVDGWQAALPAHRIAAAVAKAELRLPTSGPLGSFIGRTI